MFWMLIAAAAVAWAQAALFHRYGGWRIAYRRYFATDRVYEGDRTELIEQIDNAKPLPVPWVRFEANIDASLHFDSMKEVDVQAGGQLFQYHKSLFSLMPYTRIRRKHGLVCRRRGIYRLQSVSVTYGDLLGLRSRTRSIQHNERLIVYPQLLADAELPPSAVRLMGELSVRRWIVEDPFEFAGIRPYRDDDPMNRIHWKASSRSEEWLVHKRDYTADLRLMLLLNVGVSEHNWRDVTDPERIESAIRLAATLASHVAASGLAVGFAHNAYRTAELSAASGGEGRRGLLGGGSAEVAAAGSADGDDGRLTPEAGTIQRHAILEELARIELRCLRPFHEHLREEADLAARAAGSSRTDYVLVTCEVTPAMERQIERLRQLGHRVDAAMVPELARRKEAAG